jgi:hypothetical protein
MPLLDRRRYSGVLPEAVRFAMLEREFRDRGHRLDADDEDT